ncbi:hypothetical protein WY02_03490 [Pseudonocardia sp. AL041005-10]|nr:hypothetical protein [Pseudonocardia sp. AL041005-10]ALE77667.1 hypothetical protein WY02_03490 [Pseudonocardia sp. AL041005-10]
MADAARDLATTLLEKFADSGSGDVRAGTVTAASPLTVDIAGTAMQLPRLASYASPAVGDVVLVLTTSRAGWTVLGKVLAP